MHAQAACFADGVEERREDGTGARRGDIALDVAVVGGGDAGPVHSGKSCEETLFAEGSPPTTTPNLFTAVEVVKRRSPQPLAAAIYTAKLRTQQQTKRNSLSL